MSDGPYRGTSSTDPDEPAVDPAKPWALQTWTSRRECPQCAVPLFAARKEGFRIDACGTCGGAWLDHLTSERAIEERNLTPAQLADVAASHAPRVPETRERKCPVCTQLLQQTLVPDARVVIDVCSPHGAWFDPDEMRLVIEAMVRRTPPKIDPEVDEIIAREAFKGQFRPPENYDPNDYGTGPTLGDVLALLLSNKSKP